MEIQIMNTIISQMTHYLTGLDWPYILTLILIGYIVKNQIVRVGKVSTIIFLFLFTVVRERKINSV